MCVHVLRHPTELNVTYVFFLFFLFGGEVGRRHHHQNSGIAHVTDVDSFASLSRPASLIVRHKWCVRRCNHEFFRVPYLMRPLADHMCSINVLKPVPQHPLEPELDFKRGLWNRYFPGGHAMSMRSIDPGMTQAGGGGPGGRNSPPGGVWGEAPGASDNFHL